MAGHFTTRSALGACVVLAGACVAALPDEPLGPGATGATTATATSGSGGTTGSTSGGGGHGGATTGAGGHGGATSAGGSGGAMVTSPSCGDPRPDGDAGVLRWAQWPMPTPPGAGLPHAATYQVPAGAPTVCDAVTGLVWERESSAELFDLDGAIAHCAALDKGNHADWRLPTRVELVSLLAYEKAPPLIDGDAFPGTLTDWYWTSSIVAGNNRSWGVDFNTGDVHFLPGDTQRTTFRVRCVR
jgi:hypothetical protein